MGDAGLAKLIDQVRASDEPSQQNISVAPPTPTCKGVAAA